MRIIVVIKLFDVFKARELNFLNGVISSAINFSLFKILEKDLSDGIYHKDIQAWSKKRTINAHLITF